MIISLNIYFDGLISGCTFSTSRCFNEYSIFLNFFTQTVNVRKKELLCSELSSFLFFRVKNVLFCCLWHLNIVLNSHSFLFLGLIMFLWSLCLYKWMDSVCLAKLVHQLPIYDTGVKLSHVKALARGISWGDAQVALDLWGSQKGPSQKITLVMYLIKKMGFDGILEDISFYVNCILLFPKPLARDLNGHWLPGFVSPSALSEHTCEGHWVSYFEREWMEQRKYNLQDQSKFSQHHCLCFPESSSFYLTTIFFSSSS